MRGGRQLVKPDVGRPLDGRVSPQLGGCTAETGRLPCEFVGCCDACMRMARLAEPRLFPHLYSDALLVVPEWTIFAASVTALTWILRLVRWHSCRARPLRSPTRDWPKRDSPESLFLGASAPCLSLRASTACAKARHIDSWPVRCRLVAPNTALPHQRD